MTIPVHPLPDLLDRSAAAYPGRPALSFMGRRWSYAQLGRLVDRAARGLQELGFGPGDRFGLCLPNTPYFVVLYYAALKAGGIVVNYNPLYVERELRHQIADSGTTIMAVPDLEIIYGKVARAADAGLTRIVVCPMAAILPWPKALGFRVLKRREQASLVTGLAHVSFRSLIADRTPPAPVAIRPETLAVLQYTGGTTGVPKGAMLSHANLVANAHQTVAHMGSLEPGAERVLAVLPMFHVFAMTSVLNFGIQTAAEIILHPRFDVEACLRAIETHKVTVFPAVPTIYGAINRLAEAQPRNLSSIKVCISGGAPLPAEVRERFVALTGGKLVEGYGLSEASPVVACNPPDGEVRPGTVGLPLVGTTVEIRDPQTGLLLPHGERGEVCVRGPQVMLGYWGRPADTEAVFTHGALRTGDIGVLDEAGYLSIVDRIKDVILCSGFNVYPRVLEEALYQHPAVAEAVVIGVPDDYRGQAPKAFVTLKPGEWATGPELREFLTAYVSKIELPKSVEIRDSLPKTMIGKLSKKELVAEEAAQG